MLGLLWFGFPQQKILVRTIFEREEYNQLKGESKETYCSKERYAYRGQEKLCSASYLEQVVEIESQYWELNPGFSGSDPCFFHYAPLQLTK